MKDFYYFLAVFLFLLVSVSSDVIEESCDKAAKGDRNINFDFCVVSLRKNPKSKTATSTDNLVPIAIETVISYAIATSSMIFKLLENQYIDKYTRSCLEGCSELYLEAETNLKSGGQAFKSKDFGTANADLSAALDDPETCEEGFKEKKGLVSPMTKENNDMFQLTVIPLAFINMIKR